MMFPEIVRALSIPARVRTGTIKDVEHVVILMQENRSFDHYFGRMPGVRGFSDPYPAPARAIAGTGRSVLIQLDGTDPQGPRLISPFHLNTRQSFEYMRVEETPHSWPDAQAAWDHGRMDRWPEAKHLHAMGYFDRSDIPFQYALAEAFTLCDAYHCSIQSSTNPNRLFLWSGTNDGLAHHGGPALGNSHDNLPQHGGHQVPYTWTTYVERLQAAGIEWAVYQDMDDNFTDNPLVGFKAFRDAANGVPGSNPELRKRALTTRGLDQLKADVQNDRLPAVSYVIATAEGSEHPGPSSPAQGAAYTAKVLQALTGNPEVWARTVLLIMFDENDGFFDHVPPPAPPSRDPSAPHGLAGLSQVSTEGEYHRVRSEADAYLEKAEYLGCPYGLGARVPAYVVSPWSRGGYVNSEVLDHTSVIRFLEARFGVREPNISPWRRAVCGDLLNAFDFANPNAASLPVLPDPEPDARRAAALPGRTIPAIPAGLKQPPRQAPGSRRHRPCLYDLDLGWRLEKEGGGMKLVFHNRGSRAAVFHVYDCLNLDAIPRRYTILPQKDAEEGWLLKGGRYDLQIMGPEGFHRRLSGSAGSMAIEVSFERTLQGFILSSDSPGLFYQVGRAATRSRLEAGQPVTILPDDDRAYDVTVTAQEHPGFLRQFAGRTPEAFQGR